MKVNLNEWTHIAVTFGEGTVKVFINGEEKGSTTTDVPASVNFGITHNDEQAPQGQPITRCFWVGYSYESVRDFRGMMSELRIWNRALTASELAEEARRYDVDPKADGLSPTGSVTKVRAMSSRTTPPTATIWHPTA